MSALDGSVVNTILPVIVQSYKSNIATIEWVVTVYLLVLSCLLLTFGRLGDIRGHKSVYVYGFVIFVVSSIFCGVAPTAGVLVIFRGTQAIGAAMLASNSPAILTKNFPSVQRGLALGLSATMTYLGLTIGPSFGGWLAQTLGWRSVFYINVPVGVIALTLSLLIIPKDNPAKSIQKFDLTGAFTFMAGLVTLLLALNQGAEWGWTSPPIILLLGAAIVFIIFFITIERRSTSPMLDLTLFNHSLFTASTVSAVLNYICVYSILFLMPFYLIQGRSLNPAQAGLLLTAQPVIMAIVAPISGSLSDRLGSRLPGLVGMAALGLGLFLLSRLGPETPFWFIVLGLSVAGFGTGTFISPNTSALMGAAPPHRQGIASGILASGRNVGMVLGIGLAGAILTTQLVNNPVDGLYQGISYGFLATAAVAVVGIVAAAIKER